MDTLTGHNLIYNFFTLCPGFSFKNPLSYFKLFSYILGHANWPHLIGNFYLILLIGPHIEEKYGFKTLLFMILFTAVATALVNIVFFHQCILGASGIAFMLIVLSSLTNFRQGEVPLTFIIILLLYIGKEIYNSLEPDQVSQFAHIFGGLCGAFLGLRFKK